MTKMTFHDKREVSEITIEKDKGLWLQSLIEKAAVTNDKKMTFNEVKSDYEASDLEDFEMFWYSKPITGLRNVGWLAV